MIVRELLTKLGFVVDDSGMKKFDSGISSLRNRLGVLHNYAMRNAVAISSFSAELSGVRGALSLVGGRVDALSDKMNRLSRNTRNVGKSARKAGSDLFTMRGVMLSALAGITTTAMTTSLTSTLDTMQSLEARMSMVPQTITSAADSFNAVAQAAIETRQPLSQFANLYIRLANAAQDVLPTEQGVIDLTSTIAKTFVIGSLTAQEQASAMLQLSQAFNKGKLDGDEFRAVMESMPGHITRALSKAMGYDTMALFYDARQKGELTVEKLVKGFQTLRESIDQQFSQMPMTISQAFTIVSNRFSRFIAGLNRESSAVTDVTNGILWAFDKIESGLDSLVDSLGGAKNAVKGFGMLFASIGTVILGGIFAASISFLVSPIGLLIAGIFALIAVGEDFYQWMNGGESVFGDWLGSWDDFKKSVQDGVDYILKDWQKLKDGFSRIGNAIVSVWNMLSETIRNKFVNPIKEDWNRMIDGFVKGKDALIRAWEEIKRVFGSGGGTVPEVGTPEYMGVPNPMVPQYETGKPAPMPPGAVPSTEPIAMNTPSPAFPEGSSPRQTAAFIDTRLGRMIAGLSQGVAAAVNVQMPTPAMNTGVNSNSYEKNVTVGSLNITMPAGSDPYAVAEEVRRQLELPDISDFSMKVIT